MAGFRELLAVEWEQNAADTFRLNFPRVPLYHGDIAKLSVEECLRLAGVAPGELDVFDGSPPCQGFSTAGKREMGDSRNQLFREFVRLLSGLRPRAFVMENVSGMVKGDFKVVFAEILRTLKACGYRVKVRLLNAMFYGVPQSRERMIFVGVRDDLGVEASHPSGWSEPVTLRSALRCVRPPEPEADIARFAIGAEWHRMTVGAKSDKYLSLVRPRLDAPCPTLTKGAGAASRASVVHPLECRKFSSHESASIASFPAAFQWLSWSSALERIGNSVPPLLMRSIARHVRTLVTRG